MSAPVRPGQPLAALAPVELPPAESARIIKQHVSDGVELAQSQRDIAVHRLVIEEIILDDVALVAEAEDEVRMPVIRHPKIFPV